MNSPLQNALAGFTDKLLAYLPNLVAGIVLIGLGVLLGWVIKRIVVHVLAILRVDRFVRRFKWGVGFSRADVRYAFFEFIGNAMFLIVFLVFLYAALEAMQLHVLSNLLEHGVLFVPKLIIALLIFGFGWVAAEWIAGQVQRALAKEEVPRATLVARFVKAFLLIFFFAMALTEIDIAREIVIIGFSVAITTLGVLTIVLTATGGKALIAKIFETLEE
jgi:Mechanosensitive ion channel, conserved TM helix